MKSSFPRVLFSAVAAAPDTGGGGAPSSPAPAAAAAPASFLGAAGDSAPAAGSPAPSGGGQPFSLFGNSVVDGGNFKEGWTSAIAETHPALANQMMRYKSEADALAGLDSLVKTVGRKSVGISYPKAGASEEEVMAFRKDAGVPLRADEYNLKPENLPEGIAWDDANGQKFAELMHAHHIPKEAAKALVQAHLENISEHAATSHQAQVAKLTEMVGKTTAEFQQEWGQDFAARKEANDIFVGARIPEADLSDPALQMALSHPAIVRIIDEARRASREAPLPGATASVASGSMSPRQQAKQIIEENPKWRSNPELARRVNDLYAQEAQAEKRRKN